MANTTATMSMAFQEVVRGWSQPQYLCGERTVISRERAGVAATRVAGAADLYGELSGNFRLRLAVFIGRHQDVEVEFRDLIAQTHNQLLVVEIQGLRRG